MISSPILTGFEVVKIFPYSQRGEGANKTYWLVYSIYTGHENPKHPEVFENLEDAVSHLSKYNYLTKPFKPIYYFKGKRSKVGKKK